MFRGVTIFLQPENADCPAERALDTFNGEKPEIPECDPGNHQKIVNAASSLFVKAIVIPAKVPSPENFIQKIFTDLLIWLNKKIFILQAATFLKDIHQRSGKTFQTKILQM